MSGAKQRMESGKDPIRRVNVFITGPHDRFLADVVSEVLETEVTLADCKNSLVKTHILKNKYFELECTVTVEPIHDIESWPRVVLTRLETLDEQALFFYAKDTGKSKNESSSLAMLATLLDDVPGFLIVPDLKSDDARVTMYEQLGFELIEVSEIKNEIACSIDGLEKNQDVDDGVFPARDLQEIFEEIMAARNSQTMTPEEKEALANRIAAELID